MNFEKAEKYRVTKPPFTSAEGDRFGAFHVPIRPGDVPLRIIVAPDDEQWQHVSVSLPHRCPTWSEMCFVKDLFWSEDEAVIQYHPRKSQYVNNHKFCLHLWRPTHIELPEPPTILVGFTE